MNPTTGTDRLIRDGQVAVLYSIGHGSGWSTWNDDWAQAMMFDPQIANIVDARGENWEAQAEVIAVMKYPGAYLGGLKNLLVQWIPRGTEFRIVEHDGDETIEIKDKLDWITA